MSPGPYDPVSTPPLSWAYTVVPILISAVLVLLVLFPRHISGLTRTGLWLLPWFPACLAVMFAASHINPWLLADDVRWTPYPLLDRCLQLTMQLSLFAFVVGLAVLLIAGVRRLIRRRHAAA
ncbi:MAG TPA: hypothetical protein VMO75_03290 [Chthoniobacterales bacterium]|nr:hypothetical protein [Chthoniobacterales bacterium]